jgi:hypothetical protein
MLCLSDHRITPTRSGAAVNHRITRWLITRSPDDAMLLCFARIQTRPAPFTLGQRSPRLPVLNTSTRQSPVPQPSLSGITFAFASRSHLRFRSQSALISVTAGKVLPLSFRSRRCRAITAIGLLGWGAPPPSTRKLKSLRSVIPGLTPRISPPKIRIAQRHTAIAPIHSVLGGQAKAACDHSPKPESIYHFFAPESIVLLGHLGSCTGAPNGQLFLCSIQ